jgi:Na+/H+ antiporter NhaD/arsenite permease-like protein
MAIGVNYGAFSTAFSASLAGLLWRDILYKKHIRVLGVEFARVNLPIIAIAMAVGCTVARSISCGIMILTRLGELYELLDR